MMQRECGETNDYIQLVTVTDLFIPYVDAALKRLGYLYKDIEFTLKGDDIYARNIGQTNLLRLKSEATHLLYREKILRETWKLREMIYSRVFGTSSSHVRYYPVDELVS